MTEAERRAGSRWLAWSRTFVGGVVVGLAVNAVSDAYKGAGAVAVAGVVFLVALVAVELRRLPAQAPVQRLVSQVSLAGAAAAVLVSLVVPAPWRPWVVLAAVALALTSCLTPRPNKDVSAQLFGVALTGAGVAVIGVGVALLLNSKLLFGVALTGLGVAGIGAGVAFLLNSELLFGVALTVSVWPGSVSAWPFC